MLLHGTSGIEGLRKNYETWAKRLISWGYVALIVDSFGPRGKSNILDDLFSIDQIMRAKDAHAAKSYLAKLPFVDDNRIAVMGWSHGGYTILHALDMSTPVEGGPFRAGVAFYPHCGKPMTTLDAPLLILIGELDAWTPTSSCKMFMPKKKSVHEVILKVYPGAYHLFDAEGVGDTYLGPYRYDPNATADAITCDRMTRARHLALFVFVDTAFARKEFRCQDSGVTSFLPKHSRHYM